MESKELHHRETHMNMHAFIQMCCAHSMHTHIETESGRKKLRDRKEKEKEKDFFKNMKNTGLSSLIVFVL